MHTSDRLLAYADKTWYLRGTKLEVVVRHVALATDVATDKLCELVEIEFVDKDIPEDVRILVQAYISPDYYESHSYSGHPNYYLSKYVALVNANMVVDVPFGTPAGEVLFGKT